MRVRVAEGVGPEEVSTARRRRRRPTRAARRTLRAGKAEAVTRERARGWRWWWQWRHRSHRRGGPRGEAADATPAGCLLHLGSSIRGGIGKRRRSSVANQVEHMTA